MSQRPRRNIVFIFGAGSSKDFGYPLGNEIFSAAYEEIAKAKDQDIKTKLETAIKEVDQVMAQVYSNLPSDRRAYPFFEEVLTFIWHARKYEYQDWNNDGEFVSLFEQRATKISKIFIEMLMLAFSAIQKHGPHAKELGEYQRFIKSLTSFENNIAFIYYSENDVTLEALKKTKDFQCSISNCHDTLSPLIIPPLYMKESYIHETNKSRVHISKRGSRVLENGVIENYRTSVDRWISEVLQSAEEVVIIGYSMPPYDFDLKSLLIKGLMANKNRSNVPVSIITKAEGHELNDLRLRFKHLAGEVRFLGQDGFLNYIKCCNP